MDMAVVRRGLGLLALAGFLVSLAVHLETLRGVDVQAAFPYVMFLHMGIFLVFGPFILVSRSDFTGKQSMRQLAAGLPRWVVVVGCLTFAYAFLNFVLFMVGYQGNPSISNGKYLLLDHGRLVHELSASQYAAATANEVRGFSGHWLVFYGLPAAYFLLWKKPESVPLADPAF